MRSLYTSFLLFILSVLSITNDSNAVESSSGRVIIEKDQHAERLNFLKQKGFDPKIIYDIGAYHGLWSKNIQRVFPNAQFHLFEANASHQDLLRATQMPFYIALLGDSDKAAVFYSNDSTGDSVLREQTKYYQDECCQSKVLPMTTLGSLVKKNNIPLPDLIKMDVQGAEKIILQGSPEVVTHAQVIILETKILEYNEDAPLILEIMNLMQNLGYRALDILELHYLPTGELNEMDVLFIKNGSPLIKSGLLIK
ncbi:FkbM family methyltransferase [Waddlia chondrophila]|uniref:Putative methyltransferase n=1 Tax=Waddlia chondrophila (strain ATCC VR-1470 / WSU 86-1044) TaxID=716544 RepID=D6YSU4_WADCW|nr:FkbM family methyltransferase [Waddlia chondrophila]ADI39139.1 putative methyltransferase [Waddlia chondrophila WSU 86-1044]